MSWARRPSLSGSSHTDGDEALDLVVVADHGVRLDQHLGPIAHRHRAVVRDRRDQPDGQRRSRVPPAPAGRPRTSRSPGTRPPDGDPPQRDLDHVLAPAGAVGLDDLGQLGLDPAPAQRRQAGAEHLAVQRVGQAERGPPPGGHDVDEPAGLERGRAWPGRGRARGRRGRTVRRRPAARARPARRRRRRPGARRPARRGRSSWAAGRSGARPRRCRRARRALARRGRAR